MIRIRGFVENFDLETKTVRVQEERSSFYNKTLSIASVHDNSVTLAPDVSVDFIIVTSQAGNGNQPGYVAIDVKPVVAKLYDADINVSRAVAKHSILLQVINELDKEVFGNLGKISDEEPLHGMGGFKHRYLQSLIKKLAEAKGFRVFVEKQIPEGVIDVVMERDGMAIACEVSITNLHNETANLQKCIQAGYCNVICIALKRSTLNNIKKRAQRVISPEDISRIDFLLPDEMEHYLDGIQSKKSAPSDNHHVIKGYRVTVNHIPVSGEQVLEKRATVAKILAQSLARGSESTQVQQS